MITGPQSPSVLYTMLLAIEDHVDFFGGEIFVHGGEGPRGARARGRSGCDSS